MYKTQKHHIICVGLLLFSLLPLFPVYGNAYEDYIAEYADMAVAQMERYGIPASVTLAQGLLESGAGRSTLAREGNNHFGIKCHAGWEGATMLRNDDKPDECFRVYGSVEESFRDHSEFLRRKRYASLFDLPEGDYAGWAHGLKRCGYATDPNYAGRLISIIELYGLDRYDNGMYKEISETVEYIHTHLKTRHVIRRSRGLHYVIAQPGDTYASIAKELKIDKRKLLRYNDVKRDGEIKEWEEVYLQEKHAEGPEDVRTATVGDGESMHSVAQRYGVQLATLQRLNPGATDAPGAVLKLRAHLTKNVNAGVGYF